jgi:hypothetical protein
MQTAVWEQGARGSAEAAQGMAPRPASCRQEWKIALDAGPRGLRQVTGMSYAHAQ